MTYEDVYIFAAWIYIYIYITPAIRTNRRWCTVTCYQRKAPHFSLSLSLPRKGSGKLLLERDTGEVAGSCVPTSISHAWAQDCILETKPSSPRSKIVSRIRPVPKRKVTLVLKNSISSRVAREIPAQGSRSLCSMSHLREEREGYLSSGTPTQ